MFDEPPLATISVPVCLLLHQLHRDIQAGVPERRPHLSWPTSWSHFSSQRGKRKWGGYERVNTN